MSEIMHVLYIVKNCLCTHSSIIFAQKQILVAKQSLVLLQNFLNSHDDVIKWKHFLHYWPFVRGIHWSPVDSPHKGQWRGAFMFFFIFAWTNGWAKTGDTSDLRWHSAHYDVTVMWNLTSENVLHITSFGVIILTSPISYPGFVLLLSGWQT